MDMGINQQQKQFIGAAMLIAGVVFFFLAISGINFLAVLWPLFVIVPGLAFFIPCLKGGDMSAFSIPGGLIAGTGVILFYQNLTGHWESWAYIWTLYGVILGMCFQYMGRSMKNAKNAAERQDAHELYEVGGYFITFSLVAFLGLASLFELAIFENRSIFAIVLLPAILIFGVLWLLSQSGGLGNSKPWAIFETTLHRLMDMLDTQFPPTEKRKRKNDELLGSQFIVEGTSEDRSTITLDQGKRT
jgi:hypothetical protein